ncbi:MAG TPA: peptidylprolyl isomerase [Candidatus Nanoarchaeia archaeon]|nr:peptidylprolyl isomerase [Candidatus Nanoarchaeia archaeon]
MADNIFQRFLKPSTKGKLWQVFAIILLILTLAAGLIAFGNYYNQGADWIAEKTNDFVQLPHTKFIPFRLGLDLSGGTQLIYKADVSQVPSGDEASAAQGVRDVIERRVNAYGVSEPLVQVQKSAGEDYRIVVELAGVKNIDEAIKMIGETPILEFKEQGTPSSTAAEDQKIKNVNAAALKTAQEALGKIRANGDFAAISAQYGESASSSASAWVDAENSPELAAQLANLKIGGVTGVVETDKGYTIAKLSAKRVETNQITGQPKIEVKASHLLICYQGAEGCTATTTKDQALAEIKKIAAIATPKNFTQLVKQYSTEPGAAQSGGELGWFGSGAMVQPFEDAVFPQKVGTISSFVKTKFGYHLIYKEDQRNLEEYEVQTIFIPKTAASTAAAGQQSWVSTQLTGKYLKRAAVQFDQTGRPEVSLTFDAAGGKLFEDLTGNNIGKPIAIFLDGEVISAPTVDTKISGGNAVITGNFTVAEANTLAERLNAGALPVPITLVSQQTVGATLGKVSVANSLQAGLWGVLLVALFMIIYYRLPGLVSVLALAIYSVLLLAIFKVWGVMLLVSLAFVMIFFQLTGGALALALLGFILIIIGCFTMPSLAQLPVTLTLPGMAGFILSIGMAVDANILIFERFKEELRSGKSVAKAIELGFNRAWLSIRDGHISTILTCLVLMFFSTSIVKGFAITLLFGVIMSLFSAITVTKNLLALLPEKWFGSSLMTGVKQKPVETENQIINK